MGRFQNVGLIIGDRMQELLQQFVSRLVQMIVMALICVISFLTSLSVTSLVRHESENVIVLVAGMSFGLVFVVLLRLSWDLRKLIRPKPAK